VRAAVAVPYVIRERGIEKERERERERERTWKNEKKEEKLLLLAHLSRKV
jgi:hypothetical protein